MTDTSPKERTDLLGRIGSTAWNMDLVVSNVLDYYEAQDKEIVASPVELDPNQLLSEIADDCGLQARRRRLNLRVEVTRLPACMLDSRHFQRIVRNMLAYSRSAGRRPETSRCGRGCEMIAIAIEVTDSGPTSFAGTTRGAVPAAEQKRGSQRCARTRTLYRARDGGSGRRTDPRPLRGRPGGD